MKIPIEWLKEYVDVNTAPSKLADRLTMAGVEVSAIEYHGNDISDVVVGKVKHMEKHPSKTDVFVCQIDTGGKIVQVVTKADNLKVGDKVPIALHGAVLPGNIRIEKRELHGIESFGMLCSTVELGISKEASGIMILDKEAALGEDIRKVIGVGGTVLEADILPNRPDCLSVIGIAREVSAIFNKPLMIKKIRVKEASERSFKSIEVIVKNKTACARYMARLIKDVKVKDSPKWLQARLISCGMRPINNIVDITNYVLLELGQPLHAFDMKNIAGGKIIVRNAKKDEKIKTLDGETRHLNPDILVISDAEKAVAIAGVIGGEDASVTQSTVTILLESAYFNPRLIHHAERDLNIKTESSIRFDKGVDWEGVETALDRAAALIQDICEGNVLRGKIDIKDKNIEQRKLVLRTENVNSLLGTAIKTSEIIAILTRLGFSVRKKSPNALNVVVPYFRTSDIEREIDLIEEVARIYGYNEIRSTLPKVYVPGKEPDHRQRSLSEIRSLLINYGLNEVITYSMFGENDVIKSGLNEYETQTIRIANAISPDMGIMRISLIPNLLKAVQHNQSHQIKDIGLFEAGKIYLKGKKDLFIEKTQLSAAIHGQIYSDYDGAKGPVDFYFIKNVVNEIFGSLNTGYKIERSKRSFCHPGKSADILLDGQYVGSFGELHPDILASYDIKGELLFIDIDLDALLNKKQIVPRFKEIPKYPTINRDIAMIVPKDVESRSIVEVIYNIGKPLVEDVQLFDRYTGRQVKDGYYSLAYSVQYRDPSKTLTDEEVNKVHADILKVLTEKLQIEARKQ